MKRVTSKLFTFVICANLLLFAAFIIARPDKYIPVCLEGICLWAECVLPSLFPFMVITLLLIKLGAADVAAKPFKKLTDALRLPPCALPLFLMSVCSGYPAGSRILCEYAQKGILSRDDCKRLAPLLSTCGPLFALGTVGVKAFGGGGVKLFLCSLISVLSCSLIYCAATAKKAKRFVPVAQAARAGGTIESAFSSAVSASLTAGAFITFFYTFGEVAESCRLLYPLTFILSPVFGQALSGGVCRGLIEATGGCFCLGAAGGFFALPLAGFLVTFGGLSILAQQLCYTQKCGVGARFFVAFKFVQGIVCFALLCLANLIC